MTDPGSDVTGWTGSRHSVVTSILTYLVLSLLTYLVTYLLT